jgi:hypothetical protein
VLGISEQARFALGLYHQQAASQAAKKSAAAAKALSGPQFDLEIASTVNENRE